jgi:hypothetical protein
MIWPSLNLLSPKRPNITTSMYVWSYRTPYHDNSGDVFGKATPAQKGISLPLTPRLDFNLSPSYNMADLQRKHDNLLKILKKSTINVICPVCFNGFPRSDKLYAHCRDMDDDIHRGLTLRRIDFGKFLECYRKALGSTISAAALPSNWRVFSAEFVAEHYGEVEGSGGAVINLETSPCREL